MATLAEALYAHLTNDAAVAALVGARIYPGVAPADASLPRITYNQIGGQHPQEASGVAGRRRVILQINSWAASDNAAGALSEKVRLALAGLQGTLGSGGSTLMIAETTLLNDPHTLPPPHSGNDMPRAWGVAAEYAFWHDEAVP